MIHLNKHERQNELIIAIQHNHKMSTQELAEYLNVSKRTIARDIAELESQGVKIYSQLGKLGGYQIKENEMKLTMNFEESQLIALFLLLKESKSHTSLPYQNEIDEIISQSLKIPNTHVRRILKNMNKYIECESQDQIFLPQLFSDILIYCSERNVMSVDFTDEEQLIAENVVFIGVICKKGKWYSVVYEIGHDCTRELPISDIQDISYSFEKKINTFDISIENYKQYLKPAD